MPNLRVVYNNAAKRATTLTASSTVGAYSAANMLTDRKTKVWRGDKTAARTIDLVWPSSETVACVAFPFCSLSKVATIRVQVFSDAAFTTQVVDSGTVSAVQSSPVGVASTDEWYGTPVGVNAYAYGGYAFAVVYFTRNTACRSMRITVSDTTNPLAYLEIGNIVVGDYWSPTYNVQAGEVSIEIADMSRHERSESGDLYTDVGARYRTMSLQLQYMPAADRNCMFRVLLGNGMKDPVMVSVVPESADKKDEELYAIYGRLSKGSAIQYQFMGQYQASLSIDEI